MSDIVFIHGMFQNPRSWDGWVRFFEERNYRCLAPAWPLHAGKPAALRARVPEGTGNLELADIVAEMEGFIRALPGRPILVGHSLGGLIVQVLVNNGLAEAGVAICPLAPNAMLSFEWNFLKNSTRIMNPLKGDQPQEMTPETFHEVFANMMSEDEANAAWARTAVHESRNVLRTALGRAGHVDLARPHVPLLFVAAAQDRIIPPALVVKNFEAYTHADSKRTYRELDGHGHFVCGEPGWEALAHTVAEWLGSEAALGRAA